VFGIVHLVWDELYKTANEVSLNYETLMPGGHLGPWEKEKELCQRKVLKKIKRWDAATSAASETRLEHKSKTLPSERGN
jgi:hypothetical protein